MIGIALKQPVFHASSQGSTFVLGGWEAHDDAALLHILHFWSRKLGQVDSAEVHRMIFMKESLPTIHAFKAEYPGSVDEIKIRHPLGMCFLRL